ncbi:MAG: tRNA pseudouridine(55) synthase TruB [Pleomorphochaeta sp.]
MGKNSHIILTNKPKDITSFKSLGSIKRNVDKKVGHAGTLDKFANGLMIVLTGSTTKLNQLFSTLDKTYIATIRFGEETSTLDIEGDVIATANIPSLDMIKDSISKNFLGEILQSPPLYSAIHVNGKRAYKIARSGKEVEMPKRPINIYAFDIISYNNQDLVCKIHVSKGTYIRSIARDLALSCDSRGHLIDLQRVSIGPFSLDEAVNTDTKENIISGINKTDDYLKRLDSVSTYYIEDEYLFDLANGKKPSYDYLIENNIKENAYFAAIYSKDEVLRCVLQLDNNKKIIKIISQINPCFDRNKK